MTKKTRIGGDSRCAARRSNGLPCGNPAVRGFRVCRAHGAGHPNKGKPGGRPPTHGLQSATLMGVLEASREALKDDPLLMDGVNEVAQIRALTLRGEAILSGEESRFLSMLDQNAPPEELSRMRERLMDWYERLVHISAETIASIDRYYSTLEKRAGGVGLDALRLGMDAMNRALDKHVPDPAVRQRIHDDINASMAGVVVGVQRPRR